MKYSDAMIPKTVSDLRLAIITVNPPDHERQWYESDFDGRYYEIDRGIENLRRRLGDAKADQVLDMVRQSKVHFLQKDKLGLRLLQDAEMVVAGRPVFAYPKRLYRWPRPMEEINPASTPLSPAFAIVFDELCELQEFVHEWPDGESSVKRASLLTTIQRQADALGPLAEHLADIMRQVNASFDNAAPGTGFSLIQDMRRILCGLSAPFSSDKERWRWPKFKNVRSAAKSVDTVTAESQR